MAKKPTVTITKENYEKLKEARAGLRILHDILGCTGSEATNRLCDLEKLEPRIMKLPAGKDYLATATEVLMVADQLLAQGEDANADLGRILDAFGCRQHPTLPGKVSFLKAEVTMMNRKIRDQAEEWGVDGAQDVRPHDCLIRTRRKVEVELRDKNKEIKKLEHQVTRLKQALRSSLATNAELGHVMGMFKEE